MKIGLLTNSLVGAGMKELDKIAEWAVANGFEDMEVGPKVPLDEKIFNKVLDRGEIDISALIYCRNFLSENEEEAQMHRKDLTDRITFAPKVGIKRIICSTGLTKDSTLTNNVILFDPSASVHAVVEVFKPFIELAEKHNVKLCFENCPIMGNISISPYMWDVLFEKLPSDKIGLVYDPSHLVWQFIDPYENILKYKHKIFHVHGKDCEVNAQELQRFGILHRLVQSGTHKGAGENEIQNTWWRYRLPGLGDLNWNRIVSNLYEADFDGTISIEHEDPVWEGSLEKVRAGLVRAQKHIRNFI